MLGCARQGPMNGMSARRTACVGLEGERLILPCLSGRGHLRAGRDQGAHFRDEGCFTAELETGSCGEPTKIAPF